MQSIHYTSELSVDTDMHTICYTFCFMRDGERLTFFLTVLSESETSKHMILIFKKIFPKMHDFLIAWLSCMHSGFVL